METTHNLVKLVRFSFGQLEVLQAVPLDLFRQQLGRPPVVKVQAVVAVEEALVMPP